MKVSVIVTTYNRPDALKKVLEGLLAQTRLPDEVVIADDGSKKETADMLAPFLTALQNVVKHVWQEDKGFRAARIRNKAILKSTGQYLILLDGDCIPERHFIKDHLALAREGYFFQGKRVLVNKSIEPSFSFTDTQSKIRLILLALLGKISNSHHILRIPVFPTLKLSKLSGIKSCNFGVFRKDIFAVNGFNHEFEGWGREDSELVVRLFKYGLKRNENPFKAICYHLWHRENQRNRIKKNDHILENAMASDNFFCNKGLSELETQEK
ncbi:MAG: glycosyltransferase [Desulfobacteraceae bacterium]|nr:glycosyltransferase [Desulfobacteraceae bacterium]